MHNKYVSLLAVIAFLAFGGNAHADRGFWFHNATSGWTTYFNVICTHGSAPATATATFYTANGVLLGSTSHVLRPNAVWNFSTLDGTGGISPAALTTASKGVVKFTSTGGSDIAAYTSQFNSTYNSGFNFIIGVTSDDN